MNARGSILSDWIVELVPWLCDLWKYSSVLEWERKGIISFGIRAVFEPWLLRQELELKSRFSMRMSKGFNNNWMSIPIKSGWSMGNWIGWKAIFMSSKMSSNLYFLVFNPWWKRGCPNHPNWTINLKLVRISIILQVQFGCNLVLVSNCQWLLQAFIGFQLRLRREMPC